MVLRRTVSRNNSYLISCATLLLRTEETVKVDKRMTLEEFKNKIVQPFMAPHTPQEFKVRLLTVGLFFKKKKISLAWVNDYFVIFFSPLLHVCFAAAQSAPTERREKRVV